jgi:hypothetical protein
MSEYPRCAVVFLRERHFPYPCAKAYLVPGNHSARHRHHRETISEGFLESIDTAQLRRDGVVRRRGHRIGRLGYVQSATRTRARRRGNATPPRRPAHRPGGARPGPGPRGRTARYCDEHGYRGRVHPPADRPGPAASPGGTGSGPAQCPGTGTGHPGRPGPRHLKRGTPASAPSMSCRASLLVWAGTAGPH